MAIEGFALVETGPAAGLFKVKFSNIKVHGDRGTPEYRRGMMQKGALIAKIITTEFMLGTRHFSKDMVELKTPMEALQAYKRDGFFYVELKGRPRDKLEALAKKYGIEKVTDEGSEG